jgi:lipopolysaccharide export system permease protein
MTSTLGRYIARTLLARLGLLVLGLAALMSMFEFLSEGDKVIAESQAVVWPIARYLLLRLPEIVSEIIPIATILSGLLTFTELARRHELTAIQTMGLSKLQLARAVLPVACLIAALQLVIEDQAVPRASNELRAWGIADYGAQAENGEHAMIWLRQGDDIVRIAGVAVAGDELTGVTIFRRDSQGNFLEQIEAETARREADGWQLLGVSRSSADPLVDAAPATSLEWPVDLEPSLLWLANAKPKETALRDLLRILERPELGTQPPYQYRVWLHERIAGPITTAVLLLLTVALARPFHNRAGRGLLLAGGIALGFACWTLDGLLLTFGELGLLPPPLAAWMPPLILLITACSIVLHDERQRATRPAASELEPPAAAVARRAAAAAGGRVVALGATGKRRGKI